MSQDVWFFVVMPGFYGLLTGVCTVGAVLTAHHLGATFDESLLLVLTALISFSFWRHTYQLRRIRYHHSQLQQMQILVSQIYATLLPLQMPDDDEDAEDTEEIALLSAEDDQ